jgi:tripartite-type tricarboxylate transporter receptor subunit TctC
MKRSEIRHAIVRYRRRAWGLKPYPGRKKLWQDAMNAGSCPSAWCYVMRAALRLSHAVAFVAALVCRPGLAHAEPGLFFEGKTITIYVGAAPGGGFDLNARLMARHLGEHIPGHPAVIVADMPAAHGIMNANFLFNTAPRDGTALGALLPYITEYQVQGVEGIEYDAARFGWIGSIAPSNEVMYVWHTVPVYNIEDLKSRQTILAVYGPVETFARLLTAVAGARFRLVKGYQGTNDANLAMERGEVEAATSSLPVLRASRSDWLKNKLIRIFFYQGFTRSPDLPDVPASIELGKTKAERDVLAFFINSSTIGRAYAAPPGVAPDVLATLRAAFDATMKDEQFLADCRDSKFDVNPRPGADLQRIVARMVAIDPATRERVREIFGAGL